jgi:hypothetical protein
MKSNSLFISSLTLFECRNFKEKNIEARNEINEINEKTIENIKWSLNHPVS